MPEVRFRLTVRHQDGREVSQTYSQAQLYLEGLDALIGMAMAMEGGEVSLAVIAPPV